MDVAFVLRHRLKELNVEQRDLATAAHVTESYISQLLNGKKAPPSPGRTEIYGKMEAFLRLPSGELSRLANLQLIEELKSKLGDPPPPLFKEIRALILRKCALDKEKQIRAIFEKEPFGELERLVTQKLLDVVKGVVRKELDREGWLRELALLSRQSYKKIRVTILEFLAADIFHVSVEDSVSFLEPVIESWDIDLESFGMEIVLNPRVASEHLKRLEFAEKEPEQPFEEEPGLQEFLHDPQLRSDATDEEIEFLRKLRFKTKRPTPLYYYRELQNLRDPLHFSTR
ncbi:MAG: helix-turn-helix transcriptional regulator [Acidobacteriota bacterium]|jgi:transcriptional regulator with XRE-family HTH domain|nr:helix-turn-helix transcriptional regulator [Acidobacteriota bacterium]